MGTQVKTFFVECGPGGAAESVVEHRINSWAQKNRVRIVSASVASINLDSSSAGWLAIVVYEEQHSD